jgi:hypothetical protein
VSQLAYRAQARRASRRRRHYRKYRLSRWATFGTGAAAPLGGWLYLGEPLHWAGLAALAVAGEAVIPVTVLVALFVLPGMLLSGLVPVRWRIRHRARHGREKCRSAVISASLRRLVLAADRYTCLYCGITQRELEELPPRVSMDGKITPRRMHVDHWFPWQPGGPTTFFNLGSLCDEDNEIKCNYWLQRNGYVWYRYRDNAGLTEHAAEISRTIRWRRWNPFRLFRAAWALGA